MTLHFATTSILRIAYERGGPDNGAPVILLHGWPDDARTFDRIVPALQAAGFQTVVPWLRGFGPTSFLSADTMRSGEIVAMAQDVLDLADTLNHKTFAVVGHDWGARIAYVLAAIYPERAARICALSVGWQPGELPTPDLEQARKILVPMVHGHGTRSRNRQTRPQGFRSYPVGDLGASGLVQGLRIRDHRQIVRKSGLEVTVHSYTVRWGEARKDPRYRDLDQRARSAQAISVPTLMIQGGADGVTVPSTTDGKEKYFTGGYRRDVLDGIGHFPTREAPDAVNKLLIDFLKSR